MAPVNEVQMEPDCASSKFKYKNKRKRKLSKTSRRKKRPKAKSENMSKCLKGDDNLQDFKNALSAQRCILVDVKEIKIENVQEGTNFGEGAVCENTCSRFQDTPVAMPESIGILDVDISAIFKTDTKPHDKKTEDDGSISIHKRRKLLDNIKKEGEDDEINADYCVASLNKKIKIEYNDSVSQSSPNVNENSQDGVDNASVKMELDDEIDDNHYTTPDEKSLMKTDGINDDLTPSENDKSDDGKFYDVNDDNEENDEGTNDGSSLSTMSAEVDLDEDYIPISDWRKRKRVRRKNCIVPNCSNTKERTPWKAFFFIPSRREIRQKWCQAMNAEATSFFSYCCEDHFDLEKDTLNYQQYKSSQIEERKRTVSLKLKKWAIPHIFPNQRQTKPSPPPKDLPKDQRQHCDIESCQNVQRTPNVQDNGKMVAHPILYNQEMNKFPTAKENPIDRANVCRCCLVRKGKWDVTRKFSSQFGDTFTYLNIIFDCFGITLRLSDADSKLICDSCATSLRHAHVFRRQIALAQTLFKEISHCTAVETEHLGVLARRAFVSKDHTYSIISRQLDYNQYNDRVEDKRNPTIVPKGRRLKLRSVTANNDTSINIATKTLNANGEIRQEFYSNEHDGTEFSDCENEASETNLNVVRGNETNRHNINKRSNVTDQQNETLKYLNDSETNEHNLNIENRRYLSEVNEHVNETNGQKLINDHETNYLSDVCEMNEQVKVMCIINKTNEHNFNSLSEMSEHNSNVNEINEQPRNNLFEKATQNINGTSKSEISAHEIRKIHKPRTNADIDETTNETMNVKQEIIDSETNKDLSLGQLLNRVIKKEYDIEFVDEFDKYRKADFCES